MKRSTSMSFHARCHSRAWSEESESIFFIHASHASNSFFGGLADKPSPGDGVVVDFQRRKENRPSAKNTSLFIVSQRQHYKALVANISPVTLN